MTPTRSRRDFLADLSWAAVLAGAYCLECVGEAAAAPRYSAGLREGRYYSRLPGRRVQCRLCPCSPLTANGLVTKRRLTTVANRGLLVDGQTCVCNVRRNVGGKLYITNYGRAGMLVAEALEKNPLHHFIPAASAMTVSAPGCNLACKGCQNWQIALAPSERVRTFEASPKRVVDLARKKRCRAIAFTYSEPMMFFEYLTDIARLAKRQGLVNTVVTGGYVNPEPLRELCGIVDAFSVSVKAFDDQSYIRYARGTLTVIKRALETIKSSGRWLEVVVLVIPTVSDDIEAMRGFVRWAKTHLGADTPIHFNRFWPSYRLTNLPQTPVSILERARAMARSEGMRFAYIGNLPGHHGANTACPRCRKTLIRRVGFSVVDNKIRRGRCSGCGATIPGVWQVG